MLTAAEEAIIRYQIARERVANSMGYFRCNDKLKGDPECLKQCESCNRYYVDKLNQK